MNNPVEVKIEQGINPLVAFLSEATCGEMCWEAREDICRCSCNGKNHGCMKTEAGIQPARTSKIDGFMYKLKSVGLGLLEEAEKINNEKPKNIEGKYTYYWSETEAGAPARLKRATEKQIEHWAELITYKEKFYEIRRGEWCWNDLFMEWPYLLWIKGGN